MNYIVAAKNEYLPFESFLAATDQSTLPNLLVLWVSDGFLDTTPLLKMATIVQHIKISNGIDEIPIVSVLGPSSSKQYRRILEEICTWNRIPLPLDHLTKKNLSHTTIYSCKASASDASLREGLPYFNNVECECDGNPRSTAAAVVNALHRGRPTSEFAFTRTIDTDDQHCQALWGELAARGVKADAHVVVLSELDTFYGQALIPAFSGIKGNDSNSDTHPNVLTFTYPAGIDGALSKNALGVEDKSNKGQSSASTPSPSLQDATEGQSQIDYFRRLADSLEEEHENLLAHGSDGIRAVVILGSDIYDKLQILRALRPRLVSTLFLTNDLDARYGHPDEWQETHNLLVATSYPLQKKWPLSRVQPLPFRDSSQTALYAATRCALQPADHRDIHAWRGRIELFEIAKNGPVSLAASKPQNPHSKDWHRKPWATHFRQCVTLIIAAIVLAIMSYLIRLTTPPPLTAKAALVIWRPFVWASRTKVALPTALYLSVVGTYWRYAAQNPLTAEPFALNNGISIWPGDFIRMLTMMLACHFICRILVRLETDAQKLAEEFGLESTRARNFKRQPQTANPGHARRRAQRWVDRLMSICIQSSSISITRRLRRLYLRHWPHGRAQTTTTVARTVTRHAPETPQQLDPSSFRGNITTKVSVISLCKRYHAWGTPRNRMIRAAILVILYFILIFSLHLTFSLPFPTLPVRGDAIGWSQVILAGSIMTTLLTTFLVIDATLSNCLFIRDLNRAPTDWNLSNPDLLMPASRFEFKDQLNALTAADCADFLDIQYIARRSSIVNRMIYCPYILIVLLIAARSSKTDDYTWPIMLIFAFAMNLSWVSYCAIRLPIEARAARTVSLNRLRSQLSKQRLAQSRNPGNLPESSSMIALESVIAEIENLKEGAFVGIWEQPLLRAILVPSGGVGLWTLLDLIPR